METILHSREERFQSRIEHSLDLIAVLDRDGIVRYSSPSLERFFGYTPDELIGQRLFDHVHPEDLSDIHQAFTAALATPELPHVVECRLHHKDGSWPIFEANGRHFRDESGARGVIVNARCITERKRAAQALAERSRRLEVIGAVSAEITRELDLSTLLALIHKGVGELLGSQSGVIYLWDEWEQVLIPKIWHGLPDWVQQVRLKLGQGIAGTVAQRREGMIINDYRNSPYLHLPYARQLTYTAMIAEPLVYRDGLLGVITVNNQETGCPFTEQDHEILRLFATQAAIAIENARLFQENHRKFEELSVLYELSQAVTGQLDVGQLAQALYRQVNRVMGTEKMVIFLYDGEHREFQVALRMIQGQPDQALWRRGPLGPGLVSAVVARRQTIRTDDYVMTCRQEGVEPIAASLPFPYWLGVPMMGGDEVVGVLALQSDCQAFTEADERFLINVANVVALAVRSVRLYEETDRRRREAEQLASVARLVDESLDVTAVGERIVQSVLSLFHVRSSSLRLLQPDGSLVAIALGGPALDYCAPGHVLPPGIGVVSRVIAEGRPVWSSDQLNDPKTRFNDDLTQRIRRSGHRSVLGVPLRAKDRIVGVLTIADQAALALENARLYTETTRQRREAEVLAELVGDINTPMNGIIGTTELVLDTSLTDEQREYIELVKTSADSLLSIINDILDFSRMEAGKFILEPRSFSLRAILSNALKVPILRAHQKGLKLTCEVSSAVPDSLVGDPIRLSQILINLVGNAIKFTEHGEVGVHVQLESMTTSDICLHVTVVDTGVGIPTAKQQVIFAPFTQVDGSTTRKYGGTGLGLSITKQLVELMQGRLWVESMAGQGSTFHFTARLGLQEPGQVDQGRPQRSGNSLPLGCHPSDSPVSAQIDLGASLSEPLTAGPLYGAIDRISRQHPTGTILAESSPIDLAPALQTLDGDRALLASLARAFVRDYRQSLAELRERSRPTMPRPWHRRPMHWCRPSNRWGKMLSSKVPPVAWTRWSANWNESWRFSTNPDGSIAHECTYPDG